MLKVFLADDDIIVIDGMKKLIPWRKLNAVIVGEARNGRSAVEQIREIRPDLVITDIKMPVMDGLELCKNIHETMANTSVILVSAYEDFTYAKTAMQYGVKDYIIKPMDSIKICQLNHKIGEIAKQVDQRNDLYFQFSDFSVEDHLLNALKTANETYLLSCLNDLYSDYESNDELLTELSFKLASMLLSILKKIGVNPEICGIRKEDMINSLFKLKSAEQFREFIWENYLSTLQYVSEKKRIKSFHIEEEAERYICENYSDTNLTVASIAGHFNITANYLSIIFRQAKGFNISTHIAGVRMEKAKELLRDQRLSISEVCGLAGYSDVHYFSKAFKKSEGITPSEFRNLVYSAEQSAGAS